MQLNPAAFNALLENLGEWFQWRRSFACPCINPNSGAPLAGCQHCNGKGRLWRTPTRALAGVASSKVQQEWAKMGLWVSGDMVLSIPENSPLYDIRQFDRVVPETSSDDFSVPLVRGAVKERIHGPIKSIERIFWFADDGSEVEGGIPAVAVDGTLSWPNGGEPPAGKAYSLSGSRYSEFYCFGPFSDDRMKHAGARLPRRMVLRRFDLLGRNGSN